MVPRVHAWQATRLTALIVKRAAKRTAASALNVTATPEELDAIWSLYLGHFERLDNLFVPPNLYDGPVDMDDFASNDMGVSAFAKTSEERLNLLLDWANSRSVLFNSTRSKTDRTYWDEADVQEGPPLKLLWHQLVGVAAIAQLFWVEADHAGSHCPGVLIADAVGVGKTALIIGAIAFIMDVKVSQDTGRALPPVLSEFCDRIRLMDTG